MSATEVSAMIAEYDATTFDSATDGLDFLAQLVEMLRPALGTELVLFNWSRAHGDCSDCGLPAAFLSVDAYGKGQDQPLCSRCAANHAADGATIDRIEMRP